MVCCLSHRLQLSEGIASEKFAQQIDEMHQKLQCLQLAFSTERAQFVSLAVPSCTLTTSASEVKRSGLWTSASSAVFTWLLASGLPLLQGAWQLFAGKTLPQLAGGRTCFPEFVGSRITDFYATGRNKLISCWQKCVDCNGSYFDW